MVSCDYLIRIIEGLTSSLTSDNFRSVVKWNEVINNFFSCRTRQNVYKRCIGFASKAYLTPKGLNVLRVTKLVLGNVIWPHSIFKFFETFCEHTSCNKLCENTNFIIFGPTDRKLWVLEIFRRSQGKAKQGMC